MGTPPLGIDLPCSDIAILCAVYDSDTFSAHVRQACGNRDRFEIIRRPELNAVIVRFDDQGWPFESFGQNLPVAQQNGWRHFAIERRLLALGGPNLRAAVMTQRRAGLKTEPAFATILALPGDPYAALLDLEQDSDDVLLARINACRG
ncbi:DUF4269 domain-containing protein [Sphingobium sp.]|uniref:DUF4269 domain-containing protein n=1 Tax=Sphingobium sp. TaxID=1912891 RepID=UPI003B3AEF42